MTDRDPGTLRPRSEGHRSRWAWMGPAALWVTAVSLALSVLSLVWTWTSLAEPASLSPVIWSLSGIALCAAGNLAGQTLALFGLVPGGRSRVRSLWALGLGVVGLAGLLAGAAFIFWARGYLGPES